MDLIPVYTSTAHEWFIKSANKEDPYTDYYMWADLSYDNETGETMPPNNWVRWGKPCFQSVG